MPGKEKRKAAEGRKKLREKNVVTGGSKKHRFTPIFSTFRDLDIHIHMMLKHCLKCVAQILEQGQKRSGTNLLS